jgi:uncharacterized protein
MKRRILITLFVVLVIFGLAAINFGNKSSSNHSITLPNDSKIEVEIADTKAKHALGLMYRQHLPENTGMLFIFDKKAKHVFWMKNTLLPLDVIWMDENMQIVDITENVHPCKEGEVCQSFMPMQPAKYVLEVNGGFSDRHDVQVGDKLILN